MDGLHWMTATEIAAAIKAGKVSAVEVVGAVLNRVEQTNGAINAFVAMRAEQAMAEAVQADKLRSEGAPMRPFHGVPISIKDILFTKDMPTTAGSRIFENFTAEQDAIVVERLRAAGAIVIGKTATPEFCHKTVTDSPLQGVTRNPWDVTRTTAGSSGGSAAAVAAGLGAVSVGTDGGGSIRLPAALCGVAGLKPSTGRVPQFPGFAGWDFLGHTGPLARSVADIALTMKVIEGPDSRDVASLRSPLAPKESGKPLRIAVARTLNHVQPEADILSAWRLAVNAARDMGAVVDEIEVSWTDPDLQFRVIVATELAHALAQYVPAFRDVMDRTLVKMIQFGAARKASELIEALRWKNEFAARVLGFFEGYDLMIVPASPVVAFSADIIGPNTIAGQQVSVYDWFGWTWPFNITGQPALSLPVWADNTLPAGMQIVGRLGADDLVLRFAQQLEDRLGAHGSRRHPNI